MLSYTQLTQTAAVQWTPPNWFQFFDKQGPPETYFAAKYGLLLKNLDRPTQMKKRRPCTHFTYKIWTSGLSKRVIEDSGNYSGTQVQQHTMYKLHSRWRFFFFFFFFGPSSHVGYSIFIFGPSSYEYSYCPRHKGVCHFKTRGKKKLNIHCLSLPLPLTLTLTTILTPNHYTTSNFGRPCTQFRLMCIAHT